MFRASGAHLQEDTVVHMLHMVLSLSMIVRGIKIMQLYGLIKHATPPGTLIESDITTCCMCKTVSS